MYETFGVTFPHCAARRPRKYIFLLPTQLEEKWYQYHWPSSSRANGKSGTLRLREMKYGYGERVCVWMVYFIENEKILLLHLTSQSWFLRLSFPASLLYVLPTSFSERSPHRVSSRAFSVISLNHYQRKPLLSLVLESPFHLILSWWIFSPKRQKNRPFEITAKSFPNCFIGPKPFVHRQKLFLVERKGILSCVVFYNGSLNTMTMKAWRGRCDISLSSST